jgi:putative PIN family toxin of toxin-antitoxin system
LTRAVLDANVLAAGFPAVRGPLAETIRLWRTQAFTLIYSEHLFRELAGVWSKRYWIERLDDVYRESSLLALRRRGVLVEPAPGVSNIATHWQDDIIIATAVAGDAEYLVGGDKDLLRLKSYRTVRIVAPLEFLEFLRAEDEAGTGS